MAIELDALHRLSADAYRRATELGLLPERGIELIDGLVVRIIPKGPRHRHAVNKLNEQFVLQSRGRYEVSCDSLSLRLGPHDVPDPDIALARPGDWSRRDPSVEDISLIVEVADSSTDRDLSDKLIRYARAGVAEYWVVDLEHDLVHVFRRPNGEEYSVHERAGSDAVVAPAEYPDVRIEVAPVVGAS
jgi:Uma2 family endonuclease